MLLTCLKLGKIQSTEYSAVAMTPTVRYTLVFGWQGWQLKRTVHHLAVSERAHVFGGTNHVPLTDGRRLLVVTINNYGKTPASIGTVAATICAEGELDSFPGWEVSDWQGHPFIKKWKGYVFGTVHSQLIDVAFPFEAGKSHCWAHLVSRHF
jgi:hypothetical protein